MPQPSNAVVIEYSSPVLRAASPASSLNTTCLDQTSLSDNEQDLPQAAFEQKWEERLGIHLIRPEELKANEDPLLPQPNGPAEERALYEQVMQSLRRQVEMLEDSDLFEQNYLRGSQIGQEVQPSSNDIDLLIQSLMSRDEDAMMTGDTAIANGPWNFHGSGPYVNHARQASLTTAGRQATKSTYT